MHVSVETKYNPHDILYYMGIDGPIKCKVWYIELIARADEVYYRYCVQAYPLKDQFYDKAYEDSLFETKKECLEAA